MMRFIVVLILLWTAGPGMAMTCMPPTIRINQEPPVFPLAERVIANIGVPEHELEFVVYGELTPIHRQPLMHEDIMEILERRWKDESDGSYETSDTDMRFFYRSHFEFTGQYFNGAVWQAVEREPIQVSLDLIGEGGYSGYIPAGAAFMLLSRHVSGFWLYHAGLCSRGYSPSDGQSSDAQKQLASCLPTDDCLQ